MSSHQAPLDYIVEIIEQRAEIERLEKELRTADGRIEQRFSNEQVRQMRQTGYCPCCGAEDRS